MADVGSNQRSEAVQLLTGQADHFALQVAKLLNGTVTRNAWVRALVKEDVSAIVAPMPQNVTHARDSRIGLVALTLHPFAPSTADLWLRVRFRMSLDDELKYLQVDSSVFGLVTDLRTGLCPIRVEYDRYKTTKQQAHIQIVGESASLGYAFAKAGNPMKPLSKLHLPVGSRRFRPTLEDFIEFLAQEGLLPSKRPGWQRVLDDSRSDWEQLQVRAAVRRFPEAAAGQLKAMGYKITEPLSG